MEETGNIIHLRGQICQSLQFGHELFGEQFYVTTLRVPRLSGAEDFLPITISERLLIDEPLTAGSMLCMEGQLRSHIFTGGEYVDQWVLGLLKDEYEKISIVSRWKARREN